MTATPVKAKRADPRQLGNSPFQIVQCGVGLSFVA